MAGAISSVDLSVVILSWNTRNLLKECLRTLTRRDHGIEVEILVVDNASEDDSRDLVRDLFPEVKLLVNPRNIGFGAGNNVAVPHTRGRYILFLNSDTTVNEGCLRGMVRYADAHPDIGVLGPKLLNPDGSLQYSCRSYPNLATGFFRNTPLGRLLPKNRFNSDYLLKGWDHATPRDVDWVSGAALMIRRSLMERIGCFDEDFWMYCEDVDLCWRANHAAYLAEGPAPASDSARAESARRLAAVTSAKSDVAAAASNLADDRRKDERAGDCPSNAAPDEAVPTAARTWRVTYLPDAVIVHHIGKSSDRVPTRMTYEFHRSQYLFYKKHYAASYPILVRPIIPLGIALRAIGQLTRYRILYYKKLLHGDLKLSGKKGKP